MNAPAPAPTKYLFDNRLDGPETPPPIPHADVEAMRASHAAEIEAVRQKAEADGRTAGKKEALAGIENTLAKKLDELASKHRALEQSIAARVDEMQANALRLALTAAERLASGLIAHQPGEQVDAFFRGCLALLPTEGRIMLHVAPELAAELTPRLHEAMARSGRQNTLDVVADADVAGADCRIVWPDGGIERHQDNIMAEIERVFATYFDAHSDNSSETGAS